MPLKLVLVSALAMVAQPALATDYYTGSTTGFNYSRQKSDEQTTANEVKRMQQTNDLNSRYVTREEFNQSKARSSNGLNFNTEEDRAAQRLR